MPTGATAPAAGAAATGGRGGSLPGGRSGAAGSTIAAGRHAAGPPIDDVTETFEDVKLLAVTGRNTRDQDVTLNFGGGQLAFVGKSTGVILATMPYRSTLRATYVRGRDPRWDPTMVSPPENLDVGGFLRTAKHWLVLQSNDAYLIVRLDDSNWRKVYQTFEARTQLTISRPASTDK
jgi:hypothetical protein